MATMRVTIDGQTVMDGDMGQWTTEPPELTSLKLKALNKDEPWCRHIMLAMADVMVGQAISGGWTLSFDHDGDSTAVTVTTR